VKVLLEANADIFIKNKAGKDALALATEHGKSEVVALLKAGRAKV